jgi:hypothetical protein
MDQFCSIQNGRLEILQRARGSRSCVAQQAMWMGQLPDDLLLEIARLQRRLLVPRIINGGIAMAAILKRVLLPRSNGV